jgi:hypothetical protein
MTTRLVIIVAALAALIAIAVSMAIGVDLPKPCADVLHSDLFSCDMAKDQK